MRRLIGSAVSLAAMLSLGSCSMLPGAATGDAEITTYLADSAGVFVGNDVGVLGVPVGTITAIEPEGGRVKVTMKVDGDVDIPADVGAAVTARSVATDRYIELTPVYDGGEKMGEKGEIPQERTRTPIDFDTVLATLSQFSKDIGGNKQTANAVKRFLQVGADAFKGNGKKINSSVTALGDAVDAVSGQRENILGTLGSLDVLTQSLAANQATIRSFTRSVATATKLLADERGNLRKALTTLSASITIVSAFADKHREQIAGSVGRLTDVIDLIMNSEKDLKEFVETFPLTLQNVDRAVGADGMAWARMSPVYLTPLGAELQAICQSLPGDLCSLFGSGSPLSDLLGGLL